MVAVFVALMFVSLVLVDLLVEKAHARRLALSLAPQRVLPRRAPSNPRGLEHWPPLPEGAYLTEGHTWLLPQEEGVFRAGVDSLIASALGAVGGVAPPKVGQELLEGAPLFQLEREGRVLTVPSPVTGRVISVNGELQNQPELVVRDPYGEGWVCSVLPMRILEDKPVMRAGAKALAWLEREANRFSEFLWMRFPSEVDLGATIQDGGTPAPGVLTDFDASAWDAFEREFLLRPG
jgi:glycine cleavage system H lipoate-binding protein